MSNAAGGISEDLVLSDVHLHNTFTAIGKDNVALSRFYFRHSKSLSICEEVSEIADLKASLEDSQDSPGSILDEDGDLLVQRLADYEVEKDVITIEHTLETPLSSVGTQVWRGSLLLCDFLVHHETKFEGCTALELGGGVGLCSIVLARVAMKVFCTDICDVLDICERNNIRNQQLFKYYNKDNPVMVVKELDFFKFSLVFDVAATGIQWTNDEKNELKRISIIIASDVIYDDRLTDAFLETVVKLFELNPNAVLYLSLEKRLNFTLEALQVASPACDYFSAKLGDMRTSCSPLNAERVPITFPQYFDYDRVKELELFKITKEQKEEPISNYQV